MQRKKILWLVSWYPNRKDKFDGDFIQRHARAAAIYHDLHVLFVTEADIRNAVEEEWNHATGLTEQIVYFKKINGFPRRILKQWKWKNLYQKAIRNYISKNGIPDCVHVHVPWNTGLLALWMKKKYKLTFIVSEHWGIYTKGLANNFYSKPKILQKLLKKIFHEANIYVTVSMFLAEQVKRVIGINPGRIIPNVVDTSLFFYNEEKYSRFSFIHVSNMVGLKNVNIILEAFSELLQQTNDSSLQLILIGNRDDEYINLASRLGLLNSSVFFRGEIAYSEVAGEMRRSHCFVIYSDSETFSCVTAEALSSGLPVVTANTGALPELVDQKNGILVPLNDKKALVEAMLLVWKNYQFFDHKHIAGEAARKYGYSKIAGQFEELYKSYCKKP